MSHKKFSVHHWGAFIAVAYATANLAGGPPSAKHRHPPASQPSRAPQEKGTHSPARSTVDSSEKEGDPTKSEDEPSGLIKEEAKSEDDLEKQVPRTTSAEDETQSLVTPARDPNDLKPLPSFRAIIRGTNVQVANSPGAELEELKKFEESAFPRPKAWKSNSWDLMLGIEGTATTGKRPRPSAEAPPRELRSEDHGQLKASSFPTPPEPWLSKLVLPDLPLRWDTKLLRYLEFYRSDPRGRSIMASWLKRQGRYQKLISRALHRHHLPQDLIYLAMVESGFNPETTSRAGAVGMWQFMASAAQGYGLKRNHWVDERRNPELSTEAAMKFLKDLYVRFGNWELALASYNAGYGGVTRSIQKYNTNDYWQLCRYEAGMPWDTVLYVPKILAAAIVGHNRTYFGFDNIQLDEERSWTLVSVPTSITLSQAARAANVTKEILEGLNPELNHGRTPPGVKSWLRIPKGYDDRFYAGLAKIKGQLARYKPYIVRLGDTEEALARSYGISKSMLRRINGIQRAEELRPGLTILVPAHVPSSLPVASNEEKNEKPSPILVPVPLEQFADRQGQRRVFYRTVPGDTLEEISNYLKVSKYDLIVWNALDSSAKLVSGMVLQAFVSPDFDESKVVLLDSQTIQVVLAGSEEFLNAYEEQKGRRRLIYRVREGDSLSSISRRFGLSVGSIMRINQFDRKAKLQPGQPVVVYVDAAQFSPRKKTEVRQRSDTESAENVAEKTLSTSDLDVSSNTISKIASDAIPKRDEQSANNSPPIKSKSRPLRSPELEEIDSLSNTDAASSINVP